MTSGSYPAEFPLTAVREILVLLRGDWRKRLPELAHRTWWVEGWALRAWLGEPDGVVFGERAVLSQEAEGLLQEVRCLAERELSGASMEGNYVGDAVFLILEVVRKLLALLQRG